MTDFSKCPPRIRRWALQLELAQKAWGVDPLVVGAIIDRESWGGELLVPRGPAGVGDSGHGRGLMQVDDRYHKGFLAAREPGGTEMWASPTWNVLYGSALLAANLEALDGNYPAAIAAYNASLSRVFKVLTTSGMEGDALVGALDALTTGHNYVSDVLTRARSWGYSQ